jgi:Rho-binding antiterminator
MMSPYRAIDCGFYDELEALATLRRTGTIRYSSTEGEVVKESQIVDVFSLNQAEFMTLQDGTTIRLDHLMEVDGKPIQWMSEEGTCQILGFSTDTSVSTFKT